MPPALFWPYNICTETINDGDLMKKYTTMEAVTMKNNSGFSSYYTIFYRLQTQQLNSWNGKSFAILKTQKESEQQSLGINLLQTHRTVFNCT
jgi:hypothetical protein